ncbi:hypothetical protein [Paenibacillus sp. LC231]|uniref:hypothetical protein n=1 Tax=Paenibacillus sp. LC231 TaxID=1120679 RepID=UPI0013923442|nr:hypothetical protein [Paenibacillus sp. LC231]
MTSSNIAFNAVCRKQPLVWKRHFEEAKSPDTSHRLTAVKRQPALAGLKALGCRECGNVI